MECRSVVSNHALNCHLDQYLIDIPINIWSALHWHLINSWFIVRRVSTNSNEPIKISWLLTNCPPRCWWSVDRVSTEVSLECRSRLNQGSWSRVSSNTPPQMILLSYCRLALACTLNFHDFCWLGEFFIFVATAHARVATMLSFWWIESILRELRRRRPSDHGDLRRPSENFCIFPYPFAKKEIVALLLNRNTEAERF